VEVQASIRQQLIDELCRKLPDDDRIKKVYRSMTDAANAGDLPVCAVQPVEETIEAFDHDTGEGKQRILSLRIVYIATKADSSDTSLDTLIDSALVWIEQKVTEDPTLGGLGFQTRIPRISWQLEKGEFAFIGAIIEVEIVYFTLADSSVSNA
jgi:hypothetical protein